MFGANQSVSIWCRAANTAGSNQLQGLFWQDINGTRLRRRGHPDNPNTDVYIVNFAGNIYSYSSIWISVLHFDNIQPSYIGVYQCTANYSGIYRNETVEIGR